MSDLIRAALRWHPTRWLTTVCLLGASAGLIWSAGQWAAGHEARQRAAALHAALDTQTWALRGATGRQSYLPDVAARQPDVQALLASPDDRACQTRVNRYLEEVARRAGAEALYLMDRHGLVLASSNWQQPDSFVGMVYARRPYFVQALAGQPGVFYGVGLTTSRPGLFIAEAVPSPHGRNSGIQGVVTVKVTLDDLATSWTKSPASPVLLRDAQGIAILTSFPEWAYRLTRPLDEAARHRLDDSAAYGQGRRFEALPWATHTDASIQADAPDTYLLRTRVGGQTRRYLALDGALPELGWTLTVMSPREEIDQARAQAYAMATLVVALLLMGTLYWRLRERRYAEQRQARQELAQRVVERTRELHDAQAFRHAMEESLLVGMRARDMAGTIIYVNRALCDMTGYEAEELLGQRPPYPYWHPEDLDKHWHDSNAALAGQAAPSGFESRVRHKQGHDVHTMVYTAPLIDADGVQRGWMSSVVDITGQKRAEARQRAQEAQLQRSSRLASLGEMASTLAHELNQPLMAMSNFAAAAKALAAGGHTELLVTSLDDIQAQARRASEIVKRIRGVVRPGANATEAVALPTVIEHVLGWLQPEVQARQAKVRRHLPPQLPALQADRVQLEQLLFNLLLNALQALDGQPASRRLVDLTVTQQPDRLVVSVADQGPGVPPDLADRLFDPFFTTKPDGLGLGLKICRTTAESLGGALHWRPRPEGGAIFEFTLPLPT